jgi:hypothetical protein
VGVRTKQHLTKLYNEEPNHEEQHEQISNELLHQVSSKENPNTEENPGIVAKKVYYPVEMEVADRYPVYKYVGYPVKQIVRIPVYIPKPYKVERIEHYPVYKYVDNPYLVYKYIEKPLPVEKVS